ncbi:hypothetical protein PV326_009897 [Microctonus aethiopoides]|nr:hypothetical protein PV326_009897 [Microctonus aethiopoides]
MWRKSLNDVKSRRRRDQLRMTCNEVHVEQVFVEEEMECSSSDDDRNNTSGSEEELEEPNIDLNDNIPLYDGASVTIAQNLELIAHRGIDIEIERGNGIVVKGIMLMGTCDLPAKCQCLNFKQFNSDYGCPSCLYRDERVQTGPRNYVHVCLYENDIQLRISENTIAYADEATLNESVMGVKGYCALSKLVPDFIKGMAIDRMHGVDGGVAKKLLTLLFDVKYARSLGLGSSGLCEIGAEDEVRSGFSMGFAFLPSCLFEELTTQK